VPDGVDGPLPLARMAGTGQGSGPAWPTVDHAGQAVVQVLAHPPAASTGSGDSDVNTAAAAAYRASVQAGKPLSERKLAGMFGKTSRRWARTGSEVRAAR
jgi:hypothetical protein